MVEGARNCYLNYQEYSQNTLRKRNTRRFIHTSWQGVQFEGRLQAAQPTTEDAADALLSFGKASESMKHSLSSWLQFSLIRFHFPDIIIFSSYLHMVAIR